MGEPVPVADENDTGVLSSFEGNCGVGVTTGRDKLEQGVLEYTGPDEMLGPPALGVKAGAWLGLNDSDAGTWIDEL